MVARELLACVTPEAIDYARSCFNKNSKSDYQKIKKLFDSRLFVASRFDDVELEILSFDWENLEHDRNWWWQLQALPFLNWYANSFELQSEQEKSLYFSLCLDAIHRWIEVANQNKNSPLVWHDHAAALRLRNLICWLLFCHDARLPVNEGSQLEPVAALVNEHLVWLSEDKNYTKHTNHGFDQAMIALTVGLMFVRKDFELHRQVNRQRLIDEITYAFTKEGVHKENSPGYQKMMLGRLKQLRTMGPLGDKEISELSEQYIERVEAFLRAITLPNGDLPMIGDTLGCNKGLEYNQVSTVDFLDYSASGYFIVRGQVLKKSFHLVFKCSHLSHYHRQDDDLSIHLFFDGESLLGDGGLGFHNEKDPRRVFLRSAEAHNTVFPVNGKAARIPSQLSQPASMKELKPGFIIAETSMWGGRLRRELDLSLLNRGEILVRDQWVDNPGVDNNILNFFVPASIDIKFECDEFKLLSKKGAPLSIDKVAGDGTPFIMVDGNDCIPCSSHKFGQFEKSSVFGWNSESHLTTEVKIRLSCEQLATIRSTEGRDAKTDPNKNIVEASGGHLFLPKNDGLLAEIEPSVRPENIVSLDEIRNLKSSHEHHEYVIEIIQALTSDDVLLEIYKGGLLKTKRTIFSAQTTRVAYGFVFILFQGKGIESFWLFQHQRNLGIYFSELDLYVSLYAHQDYSHYKAWEAFISVKRFKSKQKNMTSSRKKNVFLFLSYPRPFHYFTDLIRAYFALRNQLPDLLFSAVYLRDSTFFKVSDGIAGEQVFDSEAQLNEWLSATQAVVMKPVGNLVSSRADELEYYDWLIAQSRKKFRTLELVPQNDYILWIGICSEKRAWDEMLEGAISLINSFQLRKPRLSVVLDGMTAPEDVEHHLFISGPGEGDYRLANFIASRFPLLNVINAVGMTAKEKMVLADKVDFFVCSFLTDSMYVARFACKPGVGHGANAAHPRQHRHPRTVLLPSDYVLDTHEVEGGSWAGVSYSISTKDMVSFCREAEKQLANIPPANEVFSGSGFSAALDKERGCYKVISETDSHSYLSLGEPHEPFSKCTQLAHENIQGEEFLFRFEAHSRLGSNVYVIGYSNGERRYTERLSAGQSKYVTFPPDVDRFRLFLRLKERDELSFFNVYFSSRSTSSGIGFSLNLPKSSGNSRKVDENLGSWLPGKLGLPYDAFSLTGFWQKVRLWLLRK